VTYATRVAATVAKAPTSVPAQPVAGIDLLTAANVGALTAVQDGTVITVTVPGQAAGAWVYLYVYTAAQALPVGWIQLDSDLRAKADLAGLPVGDHKLAVLDEAGALLGWVSAVVDGATVAPVEPSASAEPSSESETPSAEPSAAAAPAETGGLRPSDWWLLGGGAVALAGLVTAGALLRPGRTRLARGGRP
jgi:hypothetical protein